MKTVTTVLIILFAAALAFLGSAALRLAGSGQADTAREPIPAPQEPEIIVEDEPDEPQQEGSADEPDEGSITAVEIYLDGDRSSGIFLGEAVYGMTSQDAHAIYGEHFSETGYLLAIENEEYSFEPGSVHHLYVYTMIHGSGWDYTRKRVTIPGEPGTDENIKLSIDNPKHNQAIEEDNKSDIGVSGWVIDLSYRDTTGIESVEVYLNGPKGFGKFLGKAEYGLQRQDVADAFGNPDYVNSGYLLGFDGSSLDAGSENTLYLYYFSSSGAYNSGIRDFTIEGEKEESAAIISVEASLDDRSIEISGWAVSSEKVEQGAPRDPDIEYSVKKIVFASDRSGNLDIYSMGLDGSGLARLTDDPVNDNYPAVSPDGKKIAYTSDINGIWQIMVMDHDGNNKRQVTSNPWRSGYPAWSFDGRFIYFEGDIEGSWEIFRIDSDGSNMKQLTFNPGVNDWHPTGHPYQYKIIYESGPSGSEELYIMDHDGKNIERISDENMRMRVPAISIDGKTIVFSDNESLYLMDIDGKNIRKIVDGLAGSRHNHFSPDNKHISFSGSIDGRLEVFIVNPDGSGLRRLTDSPGSDWDPYFLYQAD